MTESTLDAPRLLEPVHPRDGVWLQDSPQNLMVINSVLTLDRMSVGELRKVFQERVIEAEGGERFPRFTRRLVERDGRTYWQEVSDFRIEQHIFTVDQGSLSSREGLQAYIGEQASKPLPMERPPWQLHFVPDFADGQSAIVSRMHHVLGDGMALIPVLFSLMDLEGEEPGQQPPKTRGIPDSMWKVGALASLLGGPILVHRALWRSDRGLFHGSELSGRKRVAWTPGFDLARVKEIKNRLGATVNDVLMTVVAGGFRRYSARHPGEPVQRVRVSMPVNVRHPEAPPSMDNRFGAVMLDLPVGIENVLHRLREIQRRMVALKRSVEPFVYYGSINVLLAILPKSASRALVDFYAKKCTAVLSNVPGPQEPLSVAGKRVRGMLFWVPQRANIGLGISILSFSGEVRIGVFADEAILTDPAELVADMEAELAHLGEKA
ncbi:MAG: WS/DGAT domain-containing protein [Holophagales bacterium]|nr:WS/DGAT domain-containing protein [Holophagales bacterium]